MSGFEGVRWRPRHAVTNAFRQKVYTRCVNILSIYTLCSVYIHTFYLRIYARCLILSRLQTYARSAQNLCQVSGGIAGTRSQMHSGSLCKLLNCNTLHAVHFTTEYFTAGKYAQNLPFSSVRWRCRHATTDAFKILHSGSL